MTRKVGESVEAQLGDRVLSDAEVDALVAGVQSGVKAVRRRRARRRAVAVALTAAAVLWIALSSRTGSPEALVDAPAPPTVEVAERAQDAPDELDDRIRAADGSRYTLVGPQTDRVVRLEAGQVDCQVAHRRDGGRFRVVVGDDEVEVTGTRFQVIADDDVLQAVIVLEGSVVVRLDDGRTRRLVAGESWSRAPQPPPQPARSPPAPATPVDDVQPDREGRAFAKGLSRFDAGDWAQARARFNEVARGPLAADARFWGAVARVRMAADAGALEVALDALAQGVPPEREGSLRCIVGRLLVALGRAGEAPPHFAVAAEDADPQARACGEAGR